MKQHDVPLVILAVFPRVEDRSAFRRIIPHSTWQVKFCLGLQDALDSLSYRGIGVVVCDSDLGEGHCWIDLVKAVRGMSNPPPVVIAPRQIDAVVWGEIKRLRGCEVLMQRFDAAEVFDVLGSAWHRWRARSGTAFEREAA